MVNIGILGQRDCGKTTTFVLFMDQIKRLDESIILGIPGGIKREATLSVDFIRFTWKGFHHVLYGTGGHRSKVTDYYRLFVLRNAERFLAMCDLSEPLEPQLEFYRSIGSEIPSRSITLCFNKYDLAPDNLNDYKDALSDVIRSDLKKLIKDTFVTVAIENDEYEEYNKNCIRAVLSLCEFTSDPFEIWESS